MPEGVIKPELYPHPDQIAAILGDEARLAIEMSKARLVTLAMPLLGRIAIRYPYFGFMSGHRIVHNLGGAAELGGMDDGLARTEHPLIRIASLDPHARLIAGDDFSAAQGRRASSRPAAKTGAVRLNMFISAPWLSCRPNRSASAPCSRS